MFQFHSNPSPLLCRIFFLTGIAVAGLGLGGCDTDEPLPVDTPEPTDDLVEVESTSALDRGWTVRVPAKIDRTVREQMSIYRVATTEPALSMAAVQDAFGVDGPTDEPPMAPGVKHIDDDGVQVFYFPDGAAMVHDIERATSEAPMTLLPEDEIWATSEVLLSRLGLDDLDTVSLQRDGIGTHRIQEYNAAAELQDEWIAHQAASFRQVIDGKPTVGPGSQVQMILADGGEVVSFSHAVRRLELDQHVVVDSPDIALHRFVDRAAATSRWGLHRAAIRGVYQLDVTEISLGYYLPAPGAEVDTVEPVYVLKGKIYGDGEFETPTSTDLMWIEPAVEGRELRSLDVRPLASI